MPRKVKKRLTRRKNSKNSFGGAVELSRHKKQQEERREILRQQRREARRAGLPTRYEPLSVVPYVTTEEPEARWSCRCRSGPDFEWYTSGHEVVQCDACDVYSHLQCYELEHLTEFQLQQHLHICDNCYNHQLQSMLLRHAFNEFVLDASNHPVRSSFYQFKDELFDNWTQYFNEYFELMKLSVDDTKKYSANYAYFYYYTHYKNKEKNCRDSRALFNFKQEMNTAIDKLQLQNRDDMDLDVHKFKNLGEWYVQVQMEECLETLNETWLEMKYRKLTDDDAQESDGTNKENDEDQQQRILSESNKKKRKETASDATCKVYRQLFSMEPSASSIDLDL